MLNLLVAVGITLSIFSTNCLAQQPGGRHLVERGVNAYVKDGADAAVKAWLKGSALETNTQALTQANTLRQVEDFYGKPEGLDIIKEHSISPRSQMIVFAINYAKGILYGRFQAYQIKSGNWVVTEFKFHTEAAALLPPEMTIGK
jgi:hypothetical protein